MGYSSTGMTLIDGIYVLVRENMDDTQQLVSLLEWNYFVKSCCREGKL